MFSFIIHIIYIKSHKFNTHERPQVTNHNFNTLSTKQRFRIKSSYLQIIYIKSHKFITHERPHEQSSRIKPPSTLPAFLITGAAKRTA